MASDLLNETKQRSQEAIARHYATKAVRERLEVFARLGTHYSDITTQAREIAEAVLASYLGHLHDTSGGALSQALLPRPEKPCSPSGPEPSATSSPFFAMAERNAREEFYHLTEDKLQVMERSVIDAKARFGEDYRRGR